MSKTSTTLALVTLAAVLLSTLTIGSTAASSKVFSNTGNNIITNQDCRAGTSCTLSSSNVVNGEPTSTTPSSSTTFGTVLSLSVSLAKKELVSILVLADSGQPVVQNFPLTITFTGTGVPPNLVATIPAGQQAFVIVPFEPPTNPGTYTVQAHFAGAEIPGPPAGTLSPSDSAVMSFTIT